MGAEQTPDTVFPTRSSVGAGARPHTIVDSNFVLVHIFRARNTFEIGPHDKLFQFGGVIVT